MDKDRLIKLIRSPEMASLEDFETILERIKEYPYCQNYRILAAKIAYDNSFKEKDNLLKDAAIYVNDRTKLKEIILKPYVSPEVELEAELEKQETEIPKIEATAEILEITTEENFVKKEALNIDQTSFDINNETKETLSPFMSTEPTLTSIEDQEIDISLETQELENFKTENEKKSISIQKNIIDVFLETQPSISKLKPNSEFTEAPRDLTANINSGGESFATETLARIYENQGKNKEAIDIYKNLILKCPEKKAYFANQINKIQ